MSGMSDSYVYILWQISCALSPAFSWLKWRLSSPVSSLFLSGTSLASRKVVQFLRPLAASWVSSATLKRPAFLLPQDKKDKFGELREPFLARKAFLLKRSKSSPGKLHLLRVPSSFRQLSYTPVLSIRLFLEFLTVLLAKFNCLLPQEMKFPTGVSLIADKVSCLEKTSLAYICSLLFGCL